MLGFDFLSFIFLRICLHLKDGITSKDGKVILIGWNMMKIFKVFSVSIVVKSKAEWKTLKHLSNQKTTGRHGISIT